MTVTNTTSNRAYQLPDAANLLSEDVLRLIAALTAIDGDIHALLNSAQTIAGTKTFSSSPVVPTASPGENTTKAASTAFVQAAVAALITNTLGGDSNYATTIASSLSALTSSLTAKADAAATTLALAGKATPSDITTAVSAAVPPGVMWPYAGSAAPTGFLLCYGQAVSRTTYAALFAAIGTTHGSGDGVNTFNVPDMRGRVAAGKDDMGGSAAGNLNVTLTGTRGSTSTGVITGLSSTAGLAIGMAAYGTGIGTNAVILSIDSSTQVTLSVNNTGTGTSSIRFGVVDGATLGATGGTQVHTLVTAQMPAHTHNTGATIGGRNTSTGGGETIVYAGSTYTGTSAGGGQAHPNVQPTAIMNYIIKT